MSRAGSRDAMLQFEKRSMPNGVETWTTSFKQWGEALQSSEKVARFTIPYKADVAPDTYRIIWNGAIWNITSAVPDRRYVDTVIDCDFSMMLDATHLGSEVTEYIDDQLPDIRPRR